jgi:hypothetical protein
MLGLAEGPAAIDNDAGALTDVSAYELDLSAGKSAPAWTPLPSDPFKGLHLHGLKPPQATPCFSTKSFSFDTPISAFGNFALAISSTQAIVALECPAMFFLVTKDGTASLAVDRGLLAATTDERGTHWFGTEMGIVCEGALAPGQLLIGDCLPPTASGKDPSAIAVHRDGPRTEAYVLSAAGTVDYYDGASWTTVYASYPSIDRWRLDGAIAILGTGDAIVAATTGPPLRVTNGVAAEIPGLPQADTVQIVDGIGPVIGTGDGSVLSLTDGVWTALDRQPGSAVFAITPFGKGFAYGGAYHAVYEYEPGKRCAATEVSFSVHEIAKLGDDVLILEHLTLAGVPHLVTLLHPL